MRRLMLLGLLLWAGGVLAHHYPADYANTAHSNATDAWTQCEMYGGYQIGRPGYNYPGWHCEGPVWYAYYAQWYFRVAAENSEGNVVTTFGIHRYSAENCPNGGRWDSTVNACVTPPPDCSVVGYDPTVIYPAGFCVDDGSGNPVSSEYESCMYNEGSVTVPRCGFVKCPDGTYINTTLNESCPLPKQCWDNSIVYGDTECPPSPYVCPDGSLVENEAQCSRADKKDKVCQDGYTIVPVDTLCPAADVVTCSDGTEAATIAECPGTPEQKATETTCYNGQRVQNPLDCPTPTSQDNDVKDKATTTTVDNGDGTSTSTMDLDLSGVNSRLDKINRSIEEQTKMQEEKLENGGGTGASIYERSGKTMSGAVAAFATSMQNSELMTSVNGVFNVAITQTSCPVWTIPAVWVFPEIVLDYHCAPFMDDVFFAVKSVIMVIATLSAITIMIVK